MPGDPRDQLRGRRGAAVAAAGLVPVGAIVMLIGLVAAPGSWLGGYVSEAAVPGLALAAAYRWGFFVLACGVALLGVTLAPVVRWAGPALGVAAVFATTSAAVPCSTGCPLPPYERFTATDLVHGGASILGLVVLAGAMFLTCRSPAAGRVQRRLAAVAVTLIVPTGAALGLTMLIAGRHPLGAALERIALVIAVSWLTGAALAESLSRRPVRGRPAPRDHATVEA